MLIKWIVCTVSDEQREAFYTSQLAWSRLTQVAGFQCQLGGWNQGNLNEACILALWEDRESYQRFMDYDHDPIFKQSQQRNTYNSIRVKLFDSNQMEQGDILSLITTAKQTGYFHFDGRTVKLENEWWVET